MKHTPVLAAFMALTLQVAMAWPSDRFCQPVQQFNTYNLTAISGKNWYEFWRNPKNDQKCINRVFDEENNVMYVTETLSREYEPINSTEYYFEKSSGEELHDAEYTYFIQFVGTDNFSWILTLTCFENHPTRQLSLSLSEPYAELRPYVKRGVRKALATMGLSNTPFYATSCSDIELRSPIRFPSDKKKG